jgi:PAS domain S-box-containing protein
MIKQTDNSADLLWNVSPVRYDGAQSFFRLNVLNREDYWPNFYAARYQEDLQPAGTLHADAIRAGMGYETEYRAIDADGKVRWIRESVRIETLVPLQSWRAVGICTDITTQKEMEQKIESRDELLRIAVEVAGVNLLVIDSQHRYMYVNRKHGVHLGKREDDMVGKTVSEVFEPQYAERFKSNLDRVFKGERIRHHQVFESITEPGTFQHFDVIIEPAIDQSGPLAVVVLVDITELDQIQEETRRLKIEAEERASILKTAQQVARDILLSRSGAEVMRHIAETARELAGAEYAAIVIDEAHEIDLPKIIAAGVIIDQDGEISPLWLAEKSLDYIKQHPGEVWRSSYLSLAEAGDSAHRLAVTGHMIGIPIVRDGSAIGAVFIGGAPDREEFGVAAEAAVVALADYAAVAIHYQRQLKQQRSLTHSFVNLLEEERRSVAYDLHDGLTQQVMAANAFLDSYCYDMTIAGVPTPQNLDKGMVCLRNAVQECRRMVNGLRALTLDEVGLVCALQQLLDEQTEIAEWISSPLIQNIGDTRYNVELETAIFRVAQEAISNARKHSETGRLSMELNERRTDNGSKSLTLTVQDWGQGFDPDGVKTVYGHLGLRSMQERTRLLEGIFSIDTSPGAGTKISAAFELSG